MHLSSALTFLSLLATVYASGQAPPRFCGSLTKAEADQICQNDPGYGPNYESVIGPKGQPAGCVCNPSVCVQPCFAVQYTSELDGSRGCCGCNQSYSYDPETLQGGCCDNGLLFSYDPISGVGGCCSGTPVASFFGTCKAPTPTAPLSPCTSPFPGGVTFGEKNFINYTGHSIYGTSLGGESGASSFRDCQALCASNPSCVACDFNTVSLNCSNYRNGNDKTPPVSNPDIDSAISPPCLTPSDKRGDLNHEIRVYNGVAYTFYCGYQLGYGNVKPTFQTPNLLTCISKCSTTPGCQGVNYPIKGPCNLKSNYEAAGSGTASSATASSGAASSTGGAAASTTA